MNDTQRRQRRLDSYRRYNRSVKGAARYRRYEVKHPERALAWSPLMLAKSGHKPPAPANPYRKVIDWLESPEGELWSRGAHSTTGPAAWLVSLKADKDKGMPEVILWYCFADKERITNSFTDPW